MVQPTTNGKSRCPVSFCYLSLRHISEVAWGDCLFFFSLEALPHTPHSSLAASTLSSQELASDPGFLTTVLCALGGFSLLLGLASREQRLQRWTRPLSGLVWAALLGLGHGFLFTGGLVSAWDQVRGAAGGAKGSRTARPRGGSSPVAGLAQASSFLCPPAPRCPFSSLSSSPCTPCCPWACGMPLLRALPHRSPTCWSLGCTLGLSRTQSRRCCHR